MPYIRPIDSLAISSKDRRPGGLILGPKTDMAYDMGYTMIFFIYHIPFARVDTCYSMHEFLFKFLIFFEIIKLSPKNISILLSFFVFMLILQFSV